MILSAYLRAWNLVALRDLVHMSGAFVPMGRGEGEGGQGCMLAEIVTYKVDGLMTAGGRSVSFRCNCGSIFYHGRNRLMLQELKLDQHSS